jgi:SAM-dependent methyltransferase
VRDDVPGDGTAVSQTYDQTYFAQGCGRPYQRDEYWLTWFSRIADRIVREIGPRTVLDAGCAMGFLVEALRDRGVEAFGLDVSEYALDQVRADIKPYCTRGSIMATLPRRYDLIVCVEVLEHLSADDAGTAAANLCGHTDDLLFSSTSSDYTEATHVNVRPPEYWAELFARQEFFRDVDYDASYVAGWAVRLRRARDPLARQIGNYERLIVRRRDENSSLRELASEHRQKIAELEAEIERLRRQRDAEAALKKSVRLRLTRRLRRTVARVFPINTRRGELLRSVVSMRAPAPPSGEASLEAAPPGGAG